MLQHEAANTLLSLYLLYTNSTHLYPDIGDTCRHRLDPPDHIEKRATSTFLHI